MDQRPTKRRPSEPTGRDRLRPGRPDPARPVAVWRWPRAMLTALPPPRPMGADDEPCSTPPAVLHRSLNGGPARPSVTSTTGGTQIPGVDRLLRAIIVHEGTGANIHTDGTTPNIVMPGSRPIENPAA